MDEGQLTTKQEALPEIVTRYLAGESLQTIAPDYKVATRTLYRWMLAGLGDQTYSDLVTHMLVSRVADADAELQVASDACQIARAREQARFARMDLERRRPALYGQRTHVTVENVGDLGERLRRALDRDVSPISVSPHAQVIDSTSTRES
jgi:hypothetical protein